MRPIDLKPSRVALARIDVIGLDDIVRAIDAGALADHLDRHRWLRERLAVDDEMAAPALAVGILLLAVVTLIGDAGVRRRMRQHLRGVGKAPRRLATECFVHDLPRRLPEIEKLRVALAPLPEIGRAHV